MTETEQQTTGPAGETLDPNAPPAPSLVEQQQAAAASQPLADETDHVNSPGVTSAIDDTPAPAAENTPYDAHAAHAEAVAAGEPFDPVAAAELHKQSLPTGETVALGQDFPDRA